MSATIIALKVESSKRDRPSKWEQAHKLLQICSQVPKTALQKIQNFYTVYWPKWIIHIANVLCKDGKENIADSRSLIFNFSSERFGNRDSVCFISTSKISQIFGQK